MATDDAIAADNKLLFLLHNSNNSEDWKKYNKPRETNTKISRWMSNYIKPIKSKP